MHQKVKQIIINTMYEVIPHSSITETLATISKGDRLRISLINTIDKGIVLQIGIMEWGGIETPFFTTSNYLAVNKRIYANSFAKLAIDLACYYGSKTITLEIIDNYVIFDISNVWEELGYKPTTNMTYNDFRNFLINELK